MSSGVVVIIGGSSELARHFTVNLLTHTQFEVLYTYNSSKDGTQKWLQSLSAEHSSRVEVDFLDATDAKKVDEFFNRQINSRILTAVVSCLAFYKPALIPLTSDELWKKHIDVNLTANFYLARAALEIFNIQTQGKLIFMSSIARKGAKGLSAYAASKAGLGGLSASIAMEFGRKNIKAYTLDLGILETEATAERVQKKMLFDTKHNPRQLVKLSEVSQTILTLIHGNHTHSNGSSLELSEGQHLDAE